MPTVITTVVDEVVEWASQFNAIFVEGARCSGKDHFIKTHMSNWLTYEPSKPRKGSANEQGSAKLPAGLDIGQAYFWFLDVARQMSNLKFLCNRSFLTSCYFDGLDEEKLSMWSKWFVSANAGLIMVVPQEKLHRQRIQMRGLSHVVTGILSEKAALARFAQSVPENRVIWFCELAKA